MRTRGAVAIAAATTAALAPALLVLGLGGTAWAFWTRAGAGTGTATVARSAPMLTVHAFPAGDVAPGESVAVRFTADNPSHTDLRLGSIDLLGISADAAHPDCPVGDLVLSPVTTAQVIPARHHGVPISATGSLTYRDTDTDQSGCQGATFTLSVGSGPAATTTP